MVGWKERRESSGRALFVRRLFPLRVRGARKRGSTPLQSISPHARRISQISVNVYLDAFPLLCANSKARCCAVVYHAFPSPHPVISESTTCGALS